MAYDANSIQKLEFPSSVQMRVGMYLGKAAKNETSPGQMNVGVREILDNSVTEALRGKASHITLTFHKDGTISCLDNGRGIPVDINKDTGKNGILMTMAELHSGGNFSGVEDGKAGAGLNGVGASCVNALSSRFDVEVFKGKFKHTLSFKEGIPGHYDKDGNFTESTKINKEKLAEDHESGTNINFKFEPRFFTPQERIIVDDIIDRCRYTVYLVDGLKIDVVDETRPPEEGGGTYNFENVGGMAGMIDFISTGDPLLSSNIDEYSKKGIFSVQATASYKTNAVVIENGKTINKEETRKIPIDVAFRFNADDKSELRSFANCIYNVRGGVHEDALKEALMDTFGKLTKDKNVSVEDVLEGLNACISVNVRDPQFDGQSKANLSGADVGRAIYTALTKEFKKFVKSSLNDNQMNAILKKIKDNSAARRAAEVAKITKKKSQSKNSSPANLPSKLKECDFPGDDLAELYICLAADTKIKLLDGSIKTIANLEKDYKNKSFWVYSANDDGEFIPAKANNVRITKYVNHLKRIYLSDGTCVDCTPEHRFMNRDTMEWVEAKDLKVNDSLFHLSFSEKNGYETVYNQIKRVYEPTHSIVNSFIDYNDSYRDDNIENYLITHHINEDKYDNSPENLIFMDKNEHFKDTKNVHRINAINALKEYTNSEEHKNKSRERIINYNKSENHIRDMKRAWKDPEKRKKMSQGVQSESGRKTISNKVKRAYADGRYDKMPQRCQSNKIAKTIYNLVDMGLELNETNYNSNKSCAACPSFDKILKYFSSYEEAIEYGKNYNYRVVGIEDLEYDEAVPVYCLTVNNDFHSYALANGLITHNCEGDSAAGTIIAARDSSFQAVLPVRGKVLNVMKTDFTKKKDVERFNANGEINDLIKALGAGVKEHFDIDRIRYGKIFLAADEDPDGQDICVLLTGVIYRLFKPMLEEGRVYKCCSPLFEIKYRKNGNDIEEYAVTEQDRIDIEDRLKKEKITYKVGRNKGLGELNADVFYQTVLNPETRRVIQVTMEDAEKADELLELAIGNESADSRKEWMIDNFDVAESMGLTI